MPVCLLILADSVSHAAHIRLVEAHSDRFFSIQKLKYRDSDRYEGHPKRFSVTKKEFRVFCDSQRLFFVSVHYFHAVLQCCMPNRKIRNLDPVN